MRALLLLLLAVTAPLVQAAATAATGLSKVACTADPARPGTTLVAVVGDSITFGFNCNTWRCGFVKVLQDSLGAAKYDVRDCGHNGLDAVKPGDGEIHHRSYWGSAEYKASLAMQPEVVIVMLGTNDADEWCLSQNGSTCPGGTSKHFASDLQSLTSGYMTLPSVKKTYLMIPPPYSHLQAVPTPVSVQECPPASTSCGETAPFNGTVPSDGQGEPEKEHAKACVINCILPAVVPVVAKALQLPPPLDLLSLLGFPGHVNKTAMPGLHPSCEGYTTIGHFIAKELFPRALRQVATSWGIGDSIEVAAGKGGLLALDPLDHLLPPLPRSYTPSDPRHAVSAASLLTFFGNLTMTPAALLFGHHNTNYEGQDFVDVNATQDRSDVLTSVGKFPGLVEYNFAWVDGSTLGAPADFTLHLRKAVARGAVPMLYWQTGNPVTHGNAKDLTGSPITAILPGGTANAEWVRRMNKVAAFVRAVQKDLPFVFRPFHENTGGWFWWGARASTPAQYRAAFNYTVSYLRNDAGLHTMLIAYAPSRPAATPASAEAAFGVDPATSRYPGDSLVDVACFDNYGATDDFAADTLVADAELVARFAAEHGKVPAICETGRAKGVQNLNASNAPSWWTAQVLTPLLGSEAGRRMAFLLTWRNSKPDSYWIPLPGQPAAPGFTAFAEDSATLFAGDFASPIAPLLQRSPVPSFCDSDGEYSLVWSDEFSGTTLNATTWTIPTGIGSSFGRTANVTVADTYVENGTLVLRSGPLAGHPNNFTTGAAISRPHGRSGTSAALGATWRYGRFCVRAKLPGAGPGKSQGMWPAHWMMPSDYSRHCGYNELDIMEMINGDARAHSTYWAWGSNKSNSGPPGSKCKGPPTRAGPSTTVDVADYWKEFHEFAVEWTPTSVRFLVDGAETGGGHGVFTNASTLPVNAHYMMLNTAVGGDWPKAPNASTVWPAYHYVDYVRVSQQESSTILQMHP